MGAQTAIGSLAERDDVTIEGEVTQVFGNAEIEIRPAGGPPPWAGGRRG